MHGMAAVYSCMVVYGWFRWYMMRYGYIYGRSLYIGAQPSASSSYSFRTDILCERIGTTLSSLEI